MLISVQTGSILDPFGIEEGFQMIADAGFDGVDINLDHCLPSRQIREGVCAGFFDQSDEAILAAIRPYREAAQKRGIRILQAHAPFPTYTTDRAMNDYVSHALKKTIMMCNFLGCKYLVVHPGFLPADARMTPDEEWALNIEMYSNLIPALKEYGVICCLENMFSGLRGKLMQAICSVPEEANHYIDLLNEIAGEELFGFCLDTGHAMLLGQDLYTVIHQLGSRIRILHVHDNNGLSDEHLFPYMGITDWDRFCRGLKEINYKNHLSFETFRGLDTFDAALTPELLKLLHATGELFVSRIEG